MSQKVSSKSVHEKFHEQTTVQRVIIGENNFTYRHLANYLNQYFKRPGKVLDIGCGSGTLSFYLAQRGHQVYGIDISEKAIKTCISSADELNLSKRTRFKMMQFPEEIPNGKYDYILLTEVIEHIQDETAVIERLYTLLKKDGMAFITTPSENAPLYKLGLASEFDRRVGHLRRYSGRKLSKKLRDKGFKVIEMVKNEGILRNSLFIFPSFGIFIRIINRLNLSDLITYIDNITLKLFGESDLIFIVKKNKEK